LLTAEQFETVEPVSAWIPNEALANAVTCEISVPGKTNSPER
jgi:hypothetical protein